MTIALFAAEKMKRDDQKLENFFKNNRNMQMQAACDMISCNLSDTSIHVLRPALLNWLLSPQMLCILTNCEISAIKDAMDSEQEFREQGGVA